MKKIIPKSLLIWVFTMMTFFVFGEVSAYAVTREEGAQWAKDRVGQWIDVDNIHGAQCKDFVAAYMADLWGVSVDGNACDLITYALPTGWERIQNTPDFLPLPGDIAVWGAWDGNPYGHCGIIVSADLDTFYSIDQNWVNSSVNGSVAAGVYHNYTTYNFWGVVRPPFTNGTNPKGCLDSVSGGLGGVNVGGWAFDEDQYGNQLSIKVVIGGEEHIIKKADKYRPDVHQAYQNVPGEYHGFDDFVYTSKNGSQEVVVIALNVGGGNDVELGRGTVNITADTGKPVISDVKVKNASSTGFTIECKVTDNLGVDRVQFPTWTEYNGRDDLTGKWNTDPAYSGKKNGDTYTFRVKKSMHNKEVGVYNTHIYAFDKVGNQTVYELKYTIQQPYVSEAAGVYKGNLYVLYNEHNIWNGSKQVAEDMGGHLAIISSEDENNYLVSLMAGKLMDYYYLGGTDAANEGEWKWVDGTSISYTNWRDGEPNNTGDEDALEIGKNGEWNDYPIGSEENNRGFIFEKDNAITPSLTPEKVIKYNNHVYASFNTPYSWKAAKVLCENMGGHLVTISSDGENDAVKQLITKGYYYIGATDEENEGEWKWVDGTEVENGTSNSYWDSGQPDNNCIENYAWIRSADGLWNDAAGAHNNVNGFILEIDTLKPKTTKTISGITYELYDNSVPAEIINTYLSGSTKKLATIGSLDSNMLSLLNSGTKTCYIAANGSSYQGISKSNGLWSKNVINNDFGFILQRTLSVNLRVTSDAIVGSEVKLSASAKGGSGTYQYQFVMRNPSTGASIVLKDYGSESVYTGRLTTSGTKVFSVNVKDSKGAVVKSGEKTIVVQKLLTAALKVNGLKGTINVEKGKNVVLTPSVSGGTGGYTYQYVMKNVSTGQSIILKNYSSATSYTGLITSVGTKIFTVNVKDSKGTVVTSNEVRVVAVNKLASVLKVNGGTGTISVSQGKSVTLKPTVAGGDGAYKYQYVMKIVSTGKIVILKDYCSDVSYTGKLTSEGDKIFYVNVKDGRGVVVQTNVVTVNVVKQFTVALRINGGTGTMNTSVGNNIVLSAAATGGDGGYTYQYVMKNVSTGQSIVLKDYSSATSYMAPIKSVGTKIFTVNVKDSKGNVATSNQVTLIAK